MLIEIAIESTIEVVDEVLAPRSSLVEFMEDARFVRLVEGVGGRFEELNAAVSGELVTQGLEKLIVDTLKELTSVKLDGESKVDT